MDRIEIINQWNLQRVFQELERGNLRIPRFQRAYVWERSKIVKLLNSISMSYPIGSFFLWETDTSMEAFGRDITEFGFPKKPQGNYFMFILDGQQRITSLYVSLMGKTLNEVDYSTICYNLDSKKFKLPQLKTEQHNIPVWKIWDAKEYSNLLMEYAKNGDFERMQALKECQEFLYNYPISIIMSRKMGLEEVVDIFERINQGGKRLSLFDLVHATVWSQDFDLREKIKDFNNEKAISLFGKIGGEIFTQSLSLNIKHDCTKLVQLKLTNQECINAWARTIECMRIAIDYVKSLGAQNLSILPYANMLAIIQHYLYIGKYNGIQPIHTKLISDWFWTVTFSNRYSSSTLTRMNEDANWISRIVAGENESRIFSISLKADDLKRVRMNTTSVVKNGILCLMASNGPRDFDNGQVVTLDNTNASRSNSKENHHFFPFSLRNTFGLTTNEANSVLNFAFISKRLNGSILNKRPSKYLAEYANATEKIVENLATHFISEKAFEAAKDDNFNAFIEERGKTIMAEINRVCQIQDPHTIAPIIDEEDIDDEIVDIDEEENL
ncbi:MAG: DUF262 domain-containing protein [Paludibacteraceae bacterium]|nr:DUF262 domain-containing protein [Paludibacteraceae bacterium]